MTVGEFLEIGEDENCTDAVCAEDTVASLADDVHNFLEGNEDSADEANSGMGQTIPRFSTKEALKAPGIVRIQPRSQSCAAGHFSKSTLRKKRIEEYCQTNIKSYFTK